MRKIARSYNAFGALEKLSSKDADDTVLNEVQFMYMPNRQIKWLFQSLDGAVDIGQTSYVAYQYDNRHRLSGMTYPSGKEISYEYDAAGRIVAIYEGLCSDPGGGPSDDEPVCDGRVEIVRYFRNGTGLFTGTTYVDPNISLNYRDGGLGRFGRIDDHSWRDTNGDALVHISHDYDSAGNRANRQDGVNPSWSESYDYDDMGQVVSLQRSDLNESWQYDPIENWMSYKKNNATENRNHNPANEILNAVVHRCKRQQSKPILCFFESLNEKNGLQVLFFRMGVGNEQHDESHRVFPKSRGLRIHNQEAGPRSSPRNQQRFSAPTLSGRQKVDLGSSSRT